MQKRLYRIEGQDAKILGVCGGGVECFRIDPTIVRLVWVLLFFCYGTGLLAYLIAALLMPKKSSIYP